MKDYRAKAEAIIQAYESALWIEDQDEDAVILKALQDAYKEGYKEGEADAWQEAKDNGLV